MNRINFSYEPRPYFTDFHQRTQRYALMVCHRRLGKTVACVNDLVVRALHTTKENARFAYVGPFRSQAKDIAWTYLKQATDGLRAGQPRESELRVKLPNGAWITIYGADNPDALRGLYFDGIVLDEFGDMKESLMREVVGPCLADRKGWLAIIGTVKGRNQFYDYWLKSQDNPQQWYSKMWQVNQTDVLDAEARTELKALLGDEGWDQEMMCNWDAVVSGTYYADSINRIQSNGQLVVDESLYDPGQKVHVAADVGLRDSTAWWFWQPRPDGIAVIDFYEAAGLHMDHYLGMLHDKGYDYHQFWLPHDAKAKTLSTRRSTVEQLRVPSSVRPDLYDGGFVYPVRMVPKLAIQHGIDAVRMLLPKCHFDMTNCAAGVDALRSYRRRYNDHTRTYADTPLHDWASNAADGFRYLALVADKSQGQLAENPPRPMRDGQLGRAVTGQGIGYTLNELWTEKDRGRRGIIRI